ncbi:MAG: ribosome small subunit-dependent GTPase A [Leptolinea sp.]|nr:ribosome small subunit-dependent GTPase A [Leptolinea sp.]
MDINKLGFNDWFKEKQKELQRVDCSPARVTAVDRESYLIHNGSVEIRAELSGNLLYNTASINDLPAVGDWVNVQYYDDGTFAIIHELFPRKSLLQRKTSGRDVDYQVIAANIDIAFILQSCDENFNIHRLERYLVMVNDGQVKPVIILTKKDLVSEDDLALMISNIQNTGILNSVYAISTRSEAGLDSVTALMNAGKTYCLLGSSGVGKTTLLNCLLGSGSFETQDVRAFDSKGRHTTTRRQLTILESGAMLVDTPGMRELGAIGMSDGISQSFSDAANLALECKFTNCTHTTETGCALVAALEDGRLSRERYESFLKLSTESNFHEMSYLEKRQKDRDFGKYIKTMKKSMKK